MAGQRASLTGLCAKGIRAKESHPGPDPLWAPHPKASPARGCPNILGHGGAPSHPPGRLVPSRGDTSRTQNQPGFNSCSGPAALCKWGHPSEPVSSSVKGGGGWLRTPEPCSATVMIKLDTQECLPGRDPCSLSGLPRLGRGGLGSKGKPGLRGARAGHSNTVEGGERSNSTPATENLCDQDPLCLSFLMCRKGIIKRGRMKCEDGAASVEHSAQSICWSWEASVVGSAFPPSPRGDQDHFLTEGI